MMTEQAETIPVDEGQATVDSTDAPVEMDWGHLAENFVTDEDLASTDDVPVEPAPSGEEPAPSEEAAPADVEPAPAAPVAEVPAPAAEAPTTEAQPQAPEAAQPQPPAEQPPPVQPEQPPAPSAEEIQATRDGYINQVAQQYQLSEEQAQQIALNPNAVIPQMLANVHVNTVEQAAQAVYSQVMTQLPQYLNDHIQRREETQTAEQQFYSQWEELADHGALVQQYGTMYRAVNPNATLEQFNREVGLQVWLAAGLDVATLAAKLDPGTTAPATPAAPAPVAPAQVPTGYSPANPGSGGPPAAPPTTNIFEQLALQPDTEEWEL